ncbi:tryptophan synthase subunit alpha [bacterium K02(2017)]|nr:tryptophan synthase subunit alpha [bacterium K02(2017)]
MKSRITKKLSSLKLNKQKAFIPFITAGYPNLKLTEKLIYTFAECDCSVVELGVPFSDPMADGPIIQKANEVALKKGLKFKDILNLVKKVRKKTDIPILLMGYYNPMFKYGLKKLAQDCNQAGVDGLLVVDLPPEEATELKSALKNSPIDLIYLLAPTSTIDRIKLAKKHGSGFTYYVSLTGVTGSANLNPKEIAQQIKKIKKYIKQPINIGFGISKPVHVKKLAPLADGVVVGSSILKIINEAGSEKKVLQQTKKYVLSMRQAL